jgi:salicylate hydroxylase
MGRLYHAKGRGLTPERVYDSLEWLYGWAAADCLDA